MAALNITADEHAYEALCKVVDDAIGSWYETGNPYPQYLLDLIEWLDSSGPYNPILGRKMNAR